jgi:type IV pilus assembly protein PilB
MYSNEEYLLTLLEEAGLIGERELATAKGNRKKNETLLEALIKAGTISDEQVAQTLATNSGMEFIDLHGYAPNPELKTLVPEEVVRRYKIVPLGYSNSGALQIAVPDPYDFETLDALPHVLQPDIDFFCATPDLIREVKSNIYGNAEDLANARVTGVEAGEGAVIQLCNNILIEGFRSRASDIHIEPLEKDVRIRYRIDGVLHDVEHHPKRLLSSMISRLKIMTGSMNVDEKRVPQDGRIQMNFQDKGMDLRVSMIPTNHGESVVMRILDKSSLRLGLSDLGFLSDDQESFERLITLPDGIVLVTGPTGSGKTTTLYACLNFINRPDRKIITVEDPVEYQLGGINQVMVKEDVGMTFAAALRSMLRQAPNIIMIGEIRDLETAGIAINAALTGHLVFSTLHTNDAPGAVARLTDIGIKPFLISSAVRAIMAQRLARKLCNDCKMPTALTEKEMRSLRIDAQQAMEANIMGPNGCNRCRKAGFRGRLAIIEILKMDDEMRTMVNQELTTPQLRKRARELGMRTLREDGVRKVLAGMTTAEEVIESTMSDSE